jgi:peptidoglycan/LPS O-acetylase OafA/YrhL
MNRPEVAPATPARPAEAASRFVKVADPGHIPAFDGVRALAVLWVILYHAWVFRCAVYDGNCDPARTGESLLVTAMGLIVGHGDLGVDVFFVLSGYLILMILLQAPRGAGRTLRETFGRFLARRFLRIYPALVVMLPLNALFFFAYFDPTQSGTDNPLFAGCREHWWSTALLVNNFSGMGGTLIDFGDGRLGCMPWTWSIAMEAQFYLASPLLAARFLRIRARAARPERPLVWWRGSLPALVLLGASILASLGIALALGLHQPGIPQERLDLYMTWLYGNPLVRCAPYLCGMAVAAYHFESRIRRGALAPVPQFGSGRALRWAARLSFLVGIFFAVIGVLPLYPWESFNLFTVSSGRWLFGVAVAVILAACAEPGNANLLWVRGLRHPFWRPIARLSYSMYLFQFIGIELARWLLQRGQMTPYSSLPAWLLFALLATALTFVVAWPSYRLIEKPAMDLRPAA